MKISVKYQAVQDAASQTTTIQCDTADFSVQANSTFTELDDCLIPDHSSKESPVYSPVRTRSQRQDTRPRRRRQSPAGPAAPVEPPLRPLRDSHRRSMRTTPRFKTRTSFRQNPDDDQSSISTSASSTKTVHNPSTQSPGSTAATPPSQCPTWT